jgi:hypothetical protein
MSEGIGRMLRGDQLLTQPDHSARAAYEARMAATVAPDTTPEREKEPVA